jgi:hypothetical protein
MPYIVLKTKDIYDTEGDSSYEEELEGWLNEREEHGYQLVGILPDHRAWDLEGNPVGRICSMLILHNPVAPPVSISALGGSAEQNPHSFE